jgi:mRNA-degrading endonuclease RelE of RelBE toxin-antitoxin system
MVGCSHTTKFIRPGIPMYRIEFTSAALDDLDSMRKFDLRRVAAEIEVQLTHEPNRETRHRKRLRPNELAEWELRIEAFRVFYDVGLEAEIVKVIAVGFKDGTDLYIHGEKYEL